MRDRRLLGVEAIVQRQEGVSSERDNHRRQAPGYQALAYSVTRLEEQRQPEAERKPAVAVRASIKPEHIICLEDGKKMKMLKRHLMTDHGLTPADYRARWNLPTDYPMVAPNYAEARRGLAMKIGLGR